MKEQSMLGIFDSGVGGFSVLREVRKVTDADILYFGDCARAPYGNRSETEIISFIKEILTHLRDNQVNHFVSACNSMSVNTTERLLAEVGIPKENYIDMIDAVKLIPFDRYSKVLIIATSATINSGLYQLILKEKGIMTSTYVPETLAKDIEVGNLVVIETSIKKIIDTALSSKATHILYACTHYPLVDVQFKAIAHKKEWKGLFVDPSVYVAQLVSSWNLAGTRNLQMETSKETEEFKSYRASMW